MGLTGDLKDFDRTSFLKIAGGVYNATQVVLGLIEAFLQDRLNRALVNNIVEARERVLRTQQIADDLAAKTYLSQVVYQAGNAANSPIVLGELNRPGSVIASKSSTFYSPAFPNTAIQRPLTRIGRNPGVGSDGKAVAFMATQVFNGRQEDGIFLSDPFGTGGRRIFQIVSLKDGPNNIPFIGIDPKDRVAVTKVDSTGGVTVAFVATDGTGTRGLFTVRVMGIDTGNITVSRVTPVMRVGDVFQAGGVDTKVTDIAVNDPLSDTGQLTYWVATSTTGTNGSTTLGQAILRANPPNIKATATTLSGTDEVQLEFQIEGVAEAHSFRTEIHPTQLEGFTPSGSADSWTVEISRTTVSAFDPSGQMVGVHTDPDANFLAEGIHAIKVGLTGLFESLGALKNNLVATFNKARSVPEGAYTDNQQSTTVLRVQEYLGTRNDNTLEFGPVIADGPGGASVSTYVTIKVPDSDYINVRSISLIGDEAFRSAFYFPLVDDVPGSIIPNLTQFKADHGIARFADPHQITFANPLGLILTSSGVEGEPPLLGDATLMLIFDPASNNSAEPVDYEGYIVIEYTRGMGDDPNVPNFIKLPVRGQGKRQPSADRTVLSDGSEAGIESRPLYVIVHGAELGGGPFDNDSPLDYFDGPGFWVRAMKAAIIEADPWLRQNPSAADESFILKDWTEDAGRIWADGFVQSAGESLTADILGNLETYGPARIHLIAHSLGTVVITNAAQRLNALPTPVMIGHVTYLDPVDYDMSLVPDKQLKLPRITVPGNVDWSEAYYRQNPTNTGPMNFTGEAIGNYPDDPGPPYLSYQRFAYSTAPPILGADLNVDLTSLGIDHSEVHQWYLSTIVLNDARWSSLTPNAAPSERGPEDHPGGTEQVVQHPWRDDEPRQPRRSTARPRRRPAARLVLVASGRRMVRPPGSFGSDSVPPQKPSVQRMDL